MSKLENESILKATEEFRLNLPSVYAENEQFLTTFSSLEMLRQMRTLQALKEIRGSRARQNATELSTLLEGELADLLVTLIPNLEERVIFWKTFLSTDKEYISLPPEFRVVTDCKIKPTKAGTKGKCISGMIGGKEYILYSTKSFYVARNEIQALHQGFGISTAEMGRGFNWRASLEEDTLIEYDVECYGIWLLPEDFDRIVFYSHGT